MQFVLSKKLSQHAPTPPVTVSTSVNQCRAATRLGRLDFEEQTAMVTFSDLTLSYQAQNDLSGPVTCPSFGSRMAGVR